MSRTIYVAGGSDERDECKAAMLALQAAGWTVTFDWTAHPVDMRGDIRGVLDAVYLWVRCPRTKSEGSHAELGIAIGAGAVEPACRRRIIVVSGPWRDHGRLFTKAADLTFDEHQQALTWLLGMAP